MFLLLLFSRIKKHMQMVTEQGGRQIISFGVLMLLNHPIYQLVWYIENESSYQNIPLRVAAMCLSISLAFNRYWPARFKSWLPLVWYFSLCFCLPFFFSFMSLMNHLSVSWLMNSMSALFFVFLLVDFISATIIVLLGSTLGMLLFFLYGAPLIIEPGSITVPAMIATFVAAIIIGGIFARNNEIIRQEKFSALHSLSASIAHEFRTPLAAIKFAMSGLSKYLPQLTDAYKKAITIEELKVKKIRPNNLKLLEEMPEGVDRLLYQANMSIDIMLMNASQLTISRMNFEKVDMTMCLETAIKRYPFSSSKHEGLINIDEHFNKFTFIGKEILLVHVLYNLMKNSFYFIDACQKGEIYIWTEESLRFNKLYFRDTAKGIDSEDLKNLFKQFYSMREGGTGVGLSFCKMVMDAFGGDIECYSVPNVHMTFVLSFPKL